MKRKRIAVLYRENCGGILRQLASGFQKTAKTIAEMDLYDDLRERIFKHNMENSVQKQKLSA